MSTTPFAHHLAGTCITLAGGSGFEEVEHLCDARELDALALASAARRPLLVRGEPGCGKSQLARVAAKLMDAPPPIVEVIHPRFEPRDLLYRYDTIRRLAHANAGTLESAEDYVDHGVLWKAWQSACNGPTVVLLDEIDKGDADVPNSLLEILGQRSFRVAEVPEMKTPELPEGAMPLVIITTNEERELPAAFVRRCIVLNLNPRKDELPVWLKARVLAHTHVAKMISEPVIDLALQQVLLDRQAAERDGFPTVGLAEALDLLNALTVLTRDEPDALREKKQIDWLTRLSAFALVKHASNDPGQHRAPVKRVEKSGG